MLPHRGGAGLSRQATGSIHQQKNKIEQPMVRIYEGELLDTSDTPCAFCVLWGIAWMFSLKCRQCFKWICVQSLKWFQKPTYTITIQCMPYIATVEGTCTWAKFACILFVSNTILYCLIVHIFIQRWCSLVGISFWLLASELGTSSTLSLLYLVWFLIEA